MKTKLLLICILITALTQAQNPINSFYINNADGFAVVTSNTPIDQSTTGANISWNFNQLV